MDMKAMMRQAQKMQVELAKAQEEIKSMTAEATAGGGMVKVVAQGDMTIQSIVIDPRSRRHRNAAGHCHRCGERGSSRRFRTGLRSHQCCDRRHEHSGLDVGIGSWNLLLPSRGCSTSSNACRA